MPEKFFNLVEGERIVEEVVPLPNLTKYFFLQGFVIATLSFFWVLIFPYVISMKVFDDKMGVIIGTMISVIIILIAAIVIWLISMNRYNHQHYWVTNKRVIYKKGIFGYKISSIPLERISDVIVSRTLFENFFGFGSVMLESLAGQMGREARLLAIPEPEKIQNIIFGLIKEKRAEEHLTM